ncbi:MAG: M20/M25/M40 family metallo-hydrolase [Erysipelotrichaceae bacterium]|nr:M20/M25/M40 family metallo-hydrolase [Erysipelotrichaceae bacterium]
MVVLIILILFVAVILIRTLLFKPQDQISSNHETIEFDGDRYVQTLAEIIKCKTISYDDNSLEDDKEFEKLVDKLPELFPNVTEKLELKRFEGRALLFHWKGQEDGEPAVFMAHYDVVPVEEENWTKPAFEALIENDVMWGRGTLDTKITFNGVLAAGEHLLSKGFTPKHDVYFAFSGGEEIGGPGANEIVNYFKEKGITPSFVIDEGGAVVKDIFPGVSEACGLVGIAEKGSMDVVLTCKSNGGHASAPSAHTPVGLLSKACVKMEEHPFKAHFDGPAGGMFDQLGRRSTFLYRMIFANMWCFSWILDLLCKKTGGQMNALVRTTVAFTQMKGSVASNVVPPTASMVANVRINPSDSSETVVNYFKQIINDENIEVTGRANAEPSHVSRTDCDGYRYIKKAIEDTWQGTVVAPYLMIQCSDSRHYDSISERVFRFSAMDVTSEELKGIHGNDEHVRLSTVKHSVEFFIRLMSQC